MAPPKSLFATNGSALTGITLGTTEGKVASWTDSVSSTVASQSTTSLQPVLTQNYIGSKPAVVFSAANGTILTTSSSRATTTSMTLFFVMKTTGTKSLSQFLSSKGVWQTGSLHLIFATGPLQISLNSTTSDYSTTWTPTTNTSFILCVSVTSSGGCVSSFRVNGLAYSSFTHSTSSVNIIPNFELGGWSVSTDRNFLGGIGEFVYFNRALTTSEIQDVEGYLAIRWSLRSSLQVSHPYYTSTTTISSISSISDLVYSYSTLDGWTNSNAAVDSTVGNPAPSYSVYGIASAPRRYAYITPNRITSLYNKTITFDVYTGTVCNFFLCDTSGAGTLLALDTRTAVSGFSSATSFSTWTSPASGTALTANVWHSIKVYINSSGSASWYLNGVLQQQGYAVSNTNVIAIHGDGGLGTSYFDNIKVYQGSFI